MWCGLTPLDNLPHASPWAWEREIAKSFVVKHGLSFGVEDALAELLARVYAAAREDAASDARASNPPRIP